MTEVQDKLDVAAVTAFTPTGLAKKVKELLRQNDVAPEDIVSVTQSRGTLILAFLAARTARSSSFGGSPSAS